MNECFFQLANTGVPGKRLFCGCWGGRDLLPLRLSGNSFVGLDNSATVMHCCRNVAVAVVGGICSAAASVQMILPFD
jgi:hypothetical protein